MKNKKTYLKCMIKLDRNKMKDELIVFGHNDLDQLGCMLNIEYAMPHIKKVYFHTNYVDIKEKTEAVIEYAQRYGNTHILITDISFSNCKPQLKELVAQAKCTLIDHHLYPDMFFDEFSNTDLKVIHDTTKSATVLCNEYLKNRGKNQSLDIFSDTTNAFDLHLKSDYYFSDGQDLNEYFWKYDIKYLFDLIVDNNYNLPNDFKRSMDIHKENSKAHIESLYKKNLIYNNGTISIGFIDTFFNEFINDEMKKGVGIVLAVNSWGIVRIRINSDFKLSDNAKDEIRLATCGTKDIGHMNAFTYKVHHVDFSKIMSSIEETVKSITDIIKKD